MTKKHIVNIIRLLFCFVILWNLFIYEEMVVHGEYDVTVANVDELKKKVLDNGTIVTTLGYYSENDGGGAKYIIQDVNSIGSIELQSGNFANLIIENNLINVKTLGAKGDGITDDSRIINYALNSGVNTVFFPKSEYLCNSHIKMRTSKVQIIGNESTLVTNDDFDEEYYEWFFSVSADCITIDKLNIECRERNTHKFKTQFGAFYSNQLVVSNCKFIIPSYVIENNPFKSIEYTNLDIYTGCNHVLIDKCTMINEADASAGMCCEIRDLQGVGSSDIYLTNCTCIHKGQDEILAVFSDTNEHTYGNTMSDVFIDGNRFIQSIGNYSRNASMTLGAGNNRGVNHISFTNNYVELQAKCIFIITGSSYDTNIINNTMSLTIDDDANYISVFYSKREDSPIKVLGNSITIKQNAQKRGTCHIEYCNEPILNMLDNNAVMNYF